MRGLSPLNHAGQPAVGRKKIETLSLDLNQSQTDARGTAPLIQWRNPYSSHHPTKLRVNPTNIQRSLPKYT